MPWCMKPLDLKIHLESRAPFEPYSYDDPIPKMLWGLLHEEDSELLLELIENFNAYCQG